MKKLHVKEFILLLVPAVALAIAGASLWQREKSSVTVESISVAVEPPLNSAESGRRFYFQGEMDTRVTIMMKHHSPSIYRRLFQEPQWQFPEMDYLLDAKGRKYGWQLPVSKGPTTMVTTLGEEVEYKGNGIYVLRLYFPLRQIPKSAGKVVLKAKVVADSQPLPITVTVRDR